MSVEVVTTTDYEEYKANFMSLAAEVVGNEQINKLAEIIDKLSGTYSVTKWKVFDGNQNSDLPVEAQNYLASRKIEGLTDATIENKTIALRTFFRTVAKPISQITANDVRMFLYQYQNEKKISDRSLECMRVIISSFWKWMVDEDIIQKNIMRSVRPIKYEKKQRHAMDMLEFEIVRDNCKDDREKAIIEFMYSTGARVSEVIGVRLSDIDFRNGSVTLFGKGQKERTSYLNAKATLAIDKYLKSRGYESEFLFASKRAPHGQLSKEAVEKEFRELRERIGKKLNKKLTPHIIRHTTATNALRSGMPLDQISKLLGHSDVSVTRIYAETCQDDVKTSHARYIV